MKEEKFTIAAVAVLAVLLIGVGFFYFQDSEFPIDDYFDFDVVTPIVEDNLNKFSSYEELRTFVKSNMEESSYGYRYYGGMAVPFAMSQTTTGVTGAMGKATEGAAEAAPISAVSDDYSTTNIQVAGVDEADIVKNDGKYIYVVSGKKIIIIDAFPAEDSRILSEILLDENPQEIFINKDKLIVFWNDYSESYDYPRHYYSSKAYVNVFDVSNRENPILKRNVSVDGSYYDSRMIGDYIYVIINQPLSFVEDDVIIPRVYAESVEKTVYDYSDMYYFDIPDYSYKFTSIISLNTQNDNEDFNLKTYMMGNTQDLYVSPQNIFITYTKRLSPVYTQQKMIDDVIIPSLPIHIANKISEVRKSSNMSFSEQFQKIMETVNEYSNGLTEQEKRDFEESLQERTQDYERDIAKLTEMTVIHKISIKDGDIEYQTHGEAPGHVLNQFSMDEYNNYFRIATTTGRLTRTAEGATSKNHVYVLDKNLKIVGAEEDLAPGESIYSARFMGDRCYLVTFRKVDPLFVIDLSDPYNPKVLGKLKIPGYSDYLHPYDENHIIGIGKETVAAEQGDFSWYQGVKLSLFDVSDVTNPKEIDKYEIGDRGTDSYALSDHKAFLFSKSKNLLVIPILLAEIDEEQYSGEVPPNAYGEYVWQGAYVFDISLENGFVVKGRIGHADEEEFLKSGYYFYSPYSVKRSLYISDVLYTISDKMIKMNDLDELDEVNKIDLPYEEEVYPVPYWG